LQQPRLEGFAGHEHDGDQSRRNNQDSLGSVAESCGFGGMDNAISHGRKQVRKRSDKKHEWIISEPTSQYGGMAFSDCRRFQNESEQPANGKEADALGQATRQRNSGPWDHYDIVHCLDGKARRIEPGSFPLAHGVSGRVGLLRGYGNGIVPILGAEFILASQEALEESLE
jgi:DNA (cytosine-5)-methyltransferase 1